MKKSRTVTQSVGVESARRLPWVDLLIDTKTELFELAMRAGLQIFQQMLEDDRTMICGRRYAHEPERPASRAGTVRSEVVLGGRKVAIRRPRARTTAGEVPLPTFQAMAQTDPLDRRVVEQMLVGVATRRYARSLEPLGPAIATRGTSKSAVSRRFVARTRQQLETWQHRPLHDLDLLVLYLDGLRFGRDCVVVALGLDATGRKHVLGLWDGSTENTAVCQDLVANLIDRGLATTRSVLVVLDGSKALRRAVDQAWGQAAWVQRCQLHKLRNVLSYLPPSRHAAARSTLVRAYHGPDVVTARRQLEALARQLETTYPSAAASVREGLEETLTVLALPVSATLRRTLATTNLVENLISRIRHVHRHVKRWRGRQMALRWAVAGVQEAARGFRRCRGHHDMRALVNALRARDERLGLTGTTKAA